MRLWERGRWQQAEETCSIEPADVDGGGGGACVLHRLDPEVWEKLLWMTMDGKSLSLASGSRRCGTNRLGCGHAKDDTSRNILWANCSVAVVHGWPSCVMDFALILLGINCYFGGSTKSFLGFISRICNFFYTGVAWLAIDNYGHGRPQAVSARRGIIVLSCLI